ncbi:MAG: hypothetical protein IKX14_05710, partial [Neisseriaceae bacterium]|nr:hypothetical protein [Neisseriaceae bacterium]
RLYWYFIAFYELSKDYQKFCSQYQFKDYSKLFLSLFWWFVVLHAIVSISDRLPDSLYENIWFLVCALILILIYCILMLTVFYQICRAINYFYYLQEQR